MMDDVWGIDEVAEGQPPKQLPAAQIVADVAEQWENIGLQENLKKREEAQEGGEVQGLYVHPSEH